MDRWRWRRNGPCQPPEDSVTISCRMVCNPRCIRPKKETDRTSGAEWYFSGNHPPVSILRLPAEIRRQIDRDTPPRPRWQDVDKTGGGMTFTFTPMRTAVTVDRVDGCRRPAPPRPSGREGTWQWHRVCAQEAHAQPSSGEYLLLPVAQTAPRRPWTGHHQGRTKIPMFRVGSRGKLG